MLKKRAFVNLEQSADLGRSWLVYGSPSVFTLLLLYNMKQLECRVVCLLVQCPPLTSCPRAWTRSCPRCFCRRTQSWRRWSTGPDGCPGSPPSPPTTRWCCSRAASWTWSSSDSLSDPSTAQLVTNTIFLSLQSSTMVVNSSPDSSDLRLTRRYLASPFLDDQSNIISRLSLVVLVTGPLTLKRRLFEQNVGPANLRFQMLQFLYKILNFRKFRSVTPFVNKIPPQETNLSTEMVSGETPGGTKDLPL